MEAYLPTHRRSDWIPILHSHFYAVVESIRTSVWAAQRRTLLRPVHSAQ